MDTLVIADLHITFNDNRENIILNFFDTIAVKYKRIIILGDFFEFWYGFKKVVISDYFKILTKLKDLKDKNIEIIYIEGNHDFNIGYFMEKILEINIYKEHFTCEINKKSFLFMHGDTINLDKDKFYSFLRLFLRSKFTEFLMNNIPPYIILSIAKHFSTTSRNYLSKNFNMTEICNKIKEKYNYDFIIAGHFHKNYHYENIYFLGDWSNSFNYLHIDNSGNIFFKEFIEKI